MSNSLITKPVMYIQSEVNGVVTCVEQRMRPEDFGNVFPENQFPTFPAINASLTRALLPIELAYGVMPPGRSSPTMRTPLNNGKPLENTGYTPFRPTGMFWERRRSTRTRHFIQAAC